MRRYLTPEDRLVQRMLLEDRRGNPFDAIFRQLDVSRKEFDVDMLADRVRHFHVPMPGAPIFIGVGVNAQSVVIVRGATTVFTTTAGSTTFKTTAVFSPTFVGIAGGGNGGFAFAVSSDQNGGGGGGGAASTTGTALVIVPGKTYTLVIPAANANLTWHDGTSNVILLAGGQNGGDNTGGAGGLAGSSTGQNLHSGGNGGNGGIEALLNSETAPAAATSAAGGAGGGSCADNSLGGQGPVNGAAGKDEAGQAFSVGIFGFGGRSGGFDINGTKYGWAGGGANNDNATDRNGQAGKQGAGKFTA